MIVPEVTLSEDDIEEITYDQEVNALNFNMVKSCKVFDKNKLDISDLSTVDNSNWMSNSLLFDQSHSFVKSEEGWNKKSAFSNQ